MRDARSLHATTGNRQDERREAEGRPTPRTRIIISGSNSAAHVAGQQRPRHRQTQTPAAALPPTVVSLFA